MSSLVYNVGLQTVTTKQLCKDEALQHNGELIHYLHFGLYIGADSVGLSGKRSSQSVIGVLLVELILQGVVTQWHHVHSLQKHTHTQLEIESSSSCTYTQRNRENYTT